MLYILDNDHNVISLAPTEENVTLWGQFISDIEKKRVAQTTVGPYWISTVFLGVDHGFSLDNTHVPLVFETMVFKQNSEIDVNMLDLYQDRYHTWQEALEGHTKVVGVIKEKLGIL
jgi:hypothetical protein